MSKIDAQIKSYLESLPVELAPLRDIALFYLAYCSSIDIDGCIQIAHRPWLGSLNYAVRLFPPAKKTWIGRFDEKKIPKNYQDLLLATNGAFVFGLSLYGLAPSMQKTPPTLDRSRRQCLDLTLANQSWIEEYAVDQTLFHFGGREYSYTENIPYFITGEPRIAAFRKTGELHTEWPLLT